MFLPDGFASSCKVPRLEFKETNQSSIGVLIAALEL